MKIEWDPRKASSNFRKHHIDFADAATIVHDDFAVTMVEDASGEERFVSLGMDALGRILVVVYTWKGTALRLISARKARRKNEGAMRAER